MTTRTQEAIGYTCVTIIIGLAVWVTVLVTTAASNELDWLQTCARDTHGSVETEIRQVMPISNDIYTRYFVRTRSGLRIEYGDMYEPE